ncbi:MAG: xanthine dehydrogenase family protein molybdopterin-binding subunit, partial [bacterium]|nr:xanthine dehydrogenase family protein molybdopterin-binding subunit [bacterium]
MTDASTDGRPWLGRSMRRREDPPLLRGQGSFVDDLRPPGVAHMAVLRSPLCHGLIRSLDVSTARAAPGVLDVLTAADVDGFGYPPAIFWRFEADLAPVPVPLLAAERVRFVGEPVAAVVAETRGQAEDALELVQVEYDPLPALVDPRAAVDASAVLHEVAPDNVILRWEGSAGDVEEQFRVAQTVVRGSFHVPRLTASPLEPRGCLTEYDADRDHLTLWCSSQDPHRPRRELEAVLGRPAGSIRVVVPDVGGAFGGKGMLQPEYAVAAVAAMRVNRPVKWIESRRENFLGSYQGRGLDADVELAVDPDGRFLALRGRLFADLGAYLNPVSPVSPTCSGLMLTGAYDIPAANVQVLGVVTTKVPTGPYRGAGRPEAMFVIERLVDLAASATGIDRAQLRRRNLVPAAAFPYRNALGYTYDSGDYVGALDAALELLPEERWRGWQAAARAEGRLVGIGMAAFVDRSGPGFWERTRIGVTASGGVVVRLGSNPHGQGHETTFAQLAADALGVTPEAVEVRHGDSADVPDGMGTYASRSVTTGGSALLVAADEVKEKARQVASHALEVAPEDLVWDGGRLHVAGAPDRGLTLAELARLADDPDRLPPDTPPGLDAVGYFSLPGLVFPFGAYAAVVEVDPDTGEVTVLRLATVDDAGTLVNPWLAEGQVQGAVAQGLAAALSEEIVYAEDGQLATASFLDYGIPSAAEVAVDLASQFRTTPSPFNPLGAKGIGE